MKARRLRRKASNYVIIDNELFRRGITSPLLKCLDQTQADYVMRELHEGICSLHTGGRSLASKVVRPVYYWPTIKVDTVQFTKRCLKCQESAHVPKAPLRELGRLISPWPFSMWGMDILGPLPMALGRTKYLLVAIDYFTKWIEAKPL